MPPKNAPLRTTSNAIFWFFGVAWASKTSGKNHCFLAALASFGRAAIRCGTIMQSCNTTEIRRFGSPKKKEKSHKNPKGKNTPRQASSRKFKSIFFTGNFREVKSTLQRFGLPKKGAARSLKRLPELSSFQDRVQQRGRSKSKKATWAEFISRSGQGSTTWPFKVLKGYLSWVHFKIRPGFNNVAIQSLKRIPDIITYVCFCLCNFKPSIVKCHC